MTANFPGTSVSALTSKSVNEKLKKPQWKTQTPQPSEVQDLVTPTSATEASTSRLAWSSTTDESLVSPSSSPPPQQQQQQQHQQHQSTMISVDAYVKNDGSNSKTAADNRSLANSVETNVHRANINDSLMPSFMPPSSLFSLFDSGNHEQHDDDEWKTVIELMREVGHQLTGLRSFIRHLRTDNAVVFRDIIQVARQINRERLPSMTDLCDDDDEEEELDTEKRDNDDDEEFVSLRSASNPSQVTRNNENDEKWFRRGAHQNGGEYFSKWLV
jgi:hypothetical protein